MSVANIAASFAIEYLECVEISICCYIIFWIFRVQYASDSHMPLWTIDRFHVSIYGGTPTRQHVVYRVEGCELVLQLVVP